MFRKTQIVFTLLFVVLVCSCRSASRDTRIEILLNNAWEFREVGTNVWFPARVPGTINMDINHHLKNTKGFVYQPADIPHSAWEYRTTFDVTQEILDQDVVQLYFKGIDTHANVYLNDSLLFRANDKYRTWLVNCKEGLKARGNVLSVIFQHKSPKKVDSIHHYSHIVELSNKETDETSTNVGICKSVYLQAWSAAKISDIYLEPDTITPKSAVYNAVISIFSVENQTVTIEVEVNNKLVTAPVSLKLNKGENNYHTQIVIDKPKLWWANGLGSPNLYEITVRLKRDQEMICESHQRFGVRTIELVTTAASKNDGFYFKLNGFPVFVRGAVYNSCYPEESEGRQKQLIESARLSNFNMIRANTYEEDSFYNLCDENGIMVWQDFPVKHPKVEKDSAIDEKLKQEIKENIKRLRNHPSVSLIWGSNQPAFTTNDGANAMFRYKFFNDILPGMIHNHCLSIPYLSETQLNKDKLTQNVDVRNGQIIGNMAIGYGIPSFDFISGSKASSNVLSEMQQRMVDEPLNANKQENDMKSYIQQNFPSPKDAETLAYITWIAQSELLKSAIENHRVHMQGYMGTIYNQLRDCSGGLTYATIDSSGNWKPAQYAIKDAFAHIRVIPQRNKGTVDVYVVSDAFKSLDAFLLIRLIDFYGNDLFVRQIPIDIKANSSSLMFSVKEMELLKNADVNNCCFVVQVNQGSKTLSQNTLYFTAFKNLFQPKYTVNFDVNDAVKGYNLILRSSVLVKNLVILTSDKDSWPSENNIDLLPGKRTKINIKYNGTKAELLKDLRFKSLADLK